MSSLKYSRGDAGEGYFRLIGLLWARVAGLAGRVINYGDQNVFDGDHHCVNVHFGTDFSIVCYLIG